jgi:hypothetical protein
MNDVAPKTTKRTPRSSRAATSGSASQPSGEVTVVQVPKPPASAMNKNRPISDLIKAHLKHLHHAESGRLPKHKRDGRTPEDIQTEAEAASYIAAVTKILHPLRRKKSKTKQSS